MAPPPTGYYKEEGHRLIGDLLIMVTKNESKESLKSLGICKGMTLEVHSSLSSFGELEGGAETVIDILKELVTEEGSIFMPALRLSKELPLSEEDKKLGITVKIKVLPPDSDRTAMGIVADTFHKFKFAEVTSLYSILYEMIFRRKSFHIFRNVGNESIGEYELNDIQIAYSEFTPLNPEIKTAIRIVPEKQTNCKRGGEYCILFYSEKKDGYLQNIGYLGEQLDLYLVSRNIGTLWFGIGKTKEELFEDMEFVIMLSIRKISDGSMYRKDMFKSKRKSVGEIWEGEQIPGVTDIVRFAPSACNSQPWLVKNDGELSVYRYKKSGKRGIMPADKVSFYNCIDMGIFICFMDICLGHNGVGFEKTLYSDSGDDNKELVLNAKYRLCR